MTIKKEIDELEKALSEFEKELKRSKEEVSDLRHANWKLRNEKEEIEKRLGLIKILQVETETDICVEEESIKELSKHVDDTKKELINAIEGRIKAHESEKAEIEEDRERLIRLFE